MKPLFYINVFFSLFLFISSIAIMCMTWMFLEPSITNWGAMTTLFTAGMLGSYGYYSNARDMKAKINNK